VGLIGSWITVASLAPKRAGAISSLPGAEYLAGLVLLAKIRAPTAPEVLAVLGINLIMFTVIELPPLGFVLAPERTRSLTEKVNRWMTDHRRILIVIVTGAAGIPTCSSRIRRPRLTHRRSIGPGRQLD
jgi:Sap, sulfolipid-1-addressing protein